MSTRHVIAKTGELGEGQMKKVNVGGRDILLVREGGTYHAYPAECPHHGGPLDEGVLCDGKVVCPWHLTSFDVSNGRAVEPPALDDLTSLEVQVVDENIVLMLPDKVPASIEPSGGPAAGDLDAREASQQGHYTARVSEAEGPAPGRNFVILGSGAAGLTAAETLRREGFHGNVTVLTAEEHLPYDRTDLSKRFLEDPSFDPPLVRSGSFYEDRGIRIAYGHRVTEVDVSEQRIRCQSGAELMYDRLLLASGSRARTLDVDGASLAGVCTLRSLDDAEQLRRLSAEADKVVVVGASFIAMEVAAALTSRGLTVTVVAPEAVPFENTFGPEIGKMLQKAHEQKGVSFRMGQTVAGFEGADGRVSGVTMDDGETIDADLVVVGIGVEPVTDYLSGVDIQSDGSVKVDRYMNVEGTENVFAAGDIALYPDARTGAPTRIEHWRLAQQLGQLAGRNMMGHNQAYVGVPFFWTRQYKVILQHVGHAPDRDEIAIDGSVEDGDFLAYHLVGSDVHAVTGCGRDQQIARLAQALRVKQPMPVKELTTAAKNLSSVPV